MTKEQLDHIRIILIDDILRNPTIMFNDNIRGIENNDIDLISVIVDLYEELHKMVTGEKYNYMFHWANKVGSWVETGEFIKYVNEIFEESEKYKDE